MLLSIVLVYNEIMCALQYESTHNLIMYKKASSTNVRALSCISGLESDTISAQRLFTIDVWYYRSTERVL